MSQPSLTLEEIKARKAEIQKFLAAQEQKPESLPSESDKFRERLLSELENAGITVGKTAGRIAGEAIPAALGQKAGMLAGAPLAPFTFGASSLIGGMIGGAAGGLAGYEGTSRAMGEVPTTRGRIQAAIMGGIPFAPEARMLGVAGQLAKVTGREMLESAGTQGLANAGAVLAPAAITGELDKVTPSEVALAGVGGAAAGAGARYGGAATSGSSIVGRKYAGEELAVGPSEKAASSLIAKRQNLGRDQDMINWELLGGINDPRIVNPSGMTKVAQIIAGESDEATRIIQTVNTTKASEVARREVGIPVDAEFTIDVLKARAQELKTVYGDVKSVSRAAKSKVDDVEDARDVMRRTWKIWKEAKDSNKGTTPALLERARKSTVKLQNVENQLDAILTRAGRPDLNQRLTQIRPQLAKLNVLEQAVEPGLRTLDISVLGDLQKAAPSLLTDDLALLARIYNIQKGAFQDAPAIQAAAANLRASNTRRLPAGMAVGGSAGASAGYLLGGPVGAVAGAVGGGLAGQAATGFASRALTGQGGGITQAIQRGLSTPQYQTNVPSNLSLFLAKSGNPAGSNVQSFIDRYRQEQQGLSPSR
jgi:hypothetical protein